MAEIRLTPHFLLSEFDCRNGVKVPPAEAGQVRELARRFLEPLRREFGPVRVVSGYRTRAYNKAVGGAPHSYHVYEQHRQGVAADVHPARGEPHEWAELLEHLRVPGLGVYTDHVHVDTRAGHARW